MAGRATNMIDAPTRRDRVASEELAGEVRLKSPSKDGQLNPACRVPDCERTAQTAGYCPRHYQQVRRHGRLTPELEYRARQQSGPILCQVPGWEEKSVARSYCARHYQQIRRHGRLTQERERAYGRKTCQVRGCRDKHVARGYCRKHCQQIHQQGRFGNRHGQFSSADQLADWSELPHLQHF